MLTKGGGIHFTVRNAEEVAAVLEKYLIRHCSPTLASLKTANLFNVPFETEEDLENQIHSWNACLTDKGVSLTILRVRRKKCARLCISEIETAQRAYTGCNSGFSSEVRI